MPDDAVPIYARRERGAPLSFTTKLYQGIGAIPDTVKNWTFNTFVLLYYNQILGLDAKRVSVALAIALVFDAVTDPLVAAWSDNLATRWGRRHPLMLAGAVPLGFAMYGVFAPWPGLGDDGLFVWLLAFVMLTRGLMTLYFVPWAAIAAELSDDYDERTSVMSYRYAVGWTIGISFPLFVYTFVLPTTAAHPVGQLNPAGYPLLAIAAGVLLTAGALATTLLTRREIPYLRQHAVAPPRFSFAGAARDLRRALQNRQFALVFVIVLLISAIAGTTANLQIYMATYFWGLNTSQLRWFSLASIGALVAFPLVAAAQSRWDKRSIFLTCSVISLLEGLLVVSLRFLDVLPENGNPRLLAILVGATTFAAAIAVIHGILGASVVADVLDDHELRTGFRQEAMFNAALSFSGKAVSGIGIVIGGMILDLVALPRGIAPADVPAAAIQRLGWIVGIGVPLLYLIPIALTTRYRLTRAAHTEIRRALDERRSRLRN
jgi:GPH family glycoside/pentoside/hexuronide:cation symporter